MRRNIQRTLQYSACSALVWCVCTVPTNQVLAVSSISVSFQNGANGYTGTFDRRISSTTSREQDGSTVESYLVDGYAPDDPLTPEIDPSPEEQGLLRFDNIFGNGAGQIPLGATILDAQLQMTTTMNSTANSPGPWGAAALLQPFDSSTSYFVDFNCGGCPLMSRGAWWQDGYTARPAGGIDRTELGDVENMNLRSIVQRWSSDPEGDNNHGIVIQAGFTGTNNGWRFYTTGEAVDPLRRPKLSVSYTTDPVSTKTFQRGLNGYAGDTMAVVLSGLIQSSSGTNPDATVDDVTYDALTGDPTVSPTSTITPPPTQLSDYQSFLDGPAIDMTPGTPPGVLDSPDQFALVKFGNVFGGGAGQSPADKSVAKAWLVLTTGEFSASARSNGHWAAYAMQRDWNSMSLYSNFGSMPGLQAADGDISASPIGPTQYGMITGSEVWFDVTTYLEAVRNGATDFGLAISAFDTSDGWQIYLNGEPESALRPRLVVVSDLSAAILAGDYNDDGIVDAADYTVWRDNLGSSSTLPNDSTPGMVTQVDYDEWKDNFGTLAGSGSGSGQAAVSGLAAAVPEPGSLWLVAAGLVCLMVSQRNKENVSR